jgi:hypothetical protein
VGRKVAMRPWLCCRDAQYQEPSEPLTERT